MPLRVRYGNIEYITAEPYRYKGLKLEEILFSSNRVGPRQWSVSVLPTRRGAFFYLQCHKYKGGIVVGIFKRMKEDMDVVFEQDPARSEEHTSELSHVSISYAVFCLKKKK